VGPHLASSNLCTERNITTSWLADYLERNHRCSQQPLASSITIQCLAYDEGGARLLLVDVDDDLVATGYLLCISLIQWPTSGCTSPTSHALHMLQYWELYSRRERIPEECDVLGGKLGHACPQMAGMFLHPIHGTCRQARWCYLGGV